MIDPYTIDPTQDEGPNWQPEPPRAPPMDEPWTQSDTLSLQRYNQAATATREQVEDGTLHPLEGRRVMAEIESDRKPLQARQQASRAREIQEQQQMILHQTAAAKALQLQDQQADAGNFGGAMATHVDPDTGQITRFYQETPGVFKPLPTEPPSGSDLGAGPRPKEWDQTPTPPPSGTDVGSGERPPAWDAQAEKPPTLTPQSDDTHVMTIWNGDKRSETTFAPDPSSPSGMRATGTRHYDEAGQLIQPSQAQQADPNQLTQADDRKLWQDSAQALNIDLRRPLTPQQQTSLRAVYNRKAAELRTSRVMQAREQEQHRTEQKKEEQKVADKFDVELRDERRALQRELDRWRADPLNGKKAPPAHLADIDAAAEKKVADRWQRQGKTPPKAFGGGEAKKPDGASAAKPKVTNENPLGLESGTEPLSALMAEENRRALEKQKAADAGRPPIEPTFMETLGFRW